MAKVKDSDKSMEDYSRRVLPRIWSPLLVQDDESLVFLGTGNLKIMLRDWEMIEKSSKTMLAAINRMVRKYGSDYYYESRKQYLEETVAHADDAKWTITQALKFSVEKPIFPSHRDPYKHFVAGDKVFTCLESQELVSPFLKADVIDNNGVKIRLALHGDYEGREASIGSREVMILHERDMEFLVGNKGYLALYSKMCDFEYAEDCLLFTTMIEDCGANYYPKALKRASEEPDVEIVDSLYVNE